MTCRPPKCCLLMVAIIVTMARAICLRGLSVA